MSGEFKRGDISMNLKIVFLSVSKEKLQSDKITGNGIVCKNDSCLHITLTKLEIHTRTKFIFKGEN